MIPCPHWSKGSSFNGGFCAAGKSCVPSGWVSAPTCHNCLGTPLPAGKRRRSLPVILDPAVVAERLAHCTPCRHNVKGECQEQLRVKPGKRAFIKSGVRRGESHCPIGLWPANNPA
jgi:hypothetical protein